MTGLPVVSRPCPLKPVPAGLDSLPTVFVAHDALSFDEELFEVSREELEKLAELFPEYSSTLLSVSSCSSFLAITRTISNHPQFIPTDSSLQ